MTEAAPSVLEAVLRHDRTVVVVMLIAVIVLCWLGIALGGGMEMSAVQMTRMLRDMAMTPAVWTPAYPVLMFVMWWAMIVAMMLPSAAPVLLIFARISRRERAQERPWVPTWALAAGYLTVWAGFSAAAVALRWGLERGKLFSPMMATITALIWRGNPRRCRIMAAHTNQACLPASVPIAGRVSCRTLACRRRWRVPNGVGARRLLPWMLLVPDDAAVLWQRYELWWIGGLAAYVLLEKLMPFRQLARLGCWCRASRLGCILLMPTSL
jgi:predicted metal-binding membrane protein